MSAGLGPFASWFSNLSAVPSLAPPLSPGTWPCLLFLKGPCSLSLHHQPAHLWLTRSLSPYPSPSGISQLPLLLTLEIIISPSSSMSASVPIPLTLLQTPATSARSHLSGTPRLLCEVGCGSDISLSQSEGLHLEGRARLGSGQGAG